MSDTILIWFNPDSDSYEVGNYQEYLAISKSSRNEDRFEVIYEFCVETANVMDKILGSLNKVKTISAPLNV